MVHWFKKKKIKLEVFTNQQYAFDQFQPMLAKKFIPDWWKKLPAVESRGYLQKVIILYL